LKKREPGIRSGYAVNLCWARARHGPSVRRSPRARGLVATRDRGVAQIGDVWTALDLGDEPPGLLYALNKSYVERDRKLADGDEVA
jgi:ThiS family.